MRQISQATWECADPGMQFDTTINRWHTAHNTGRINGSNPCSEYMHLDNSACNLASLNLLRFLGEDDTFDVEGFRAAVEVVFTAQEILVGNADYPTEPIAENSRRFRQLGLGYANLGALLMALGLPYDSEEGRAWAAAVTALMTGHAYATSARTAARMGPFAGYAENREHMLRVLDMHRAEVAHVDASLVPDSLLAAARTSWDEACRRGAEVGVRNSQASVLAPTGTIGLMMDCDTTGIEPDLGWSSSRSWSAAAPCQDRQPDGAAGAAPPRLPAQRGGGDRRLHRRAQDHPRRTASRQPGLPVFACSMGDNVIHYLGHVKHDGRGAAVHLRRHLQDGEHAGGGHRRGGRAAPHRCVAARRQGRRHLPRQLQGGPAARHGQVRRRRGAGRRRRPRRRGRGHAGGRADRREDRPRADPRDACPAPARRARSSSGWRTARASSPSASTRTVAPASCSSGCRSRAPPWPASWMRSPSR